MNSKRVYVLDYNGKNIAGDCVWFHHAELVKPDYKNPNCHLFIQVFRKSSGYRYSLDGKLIVHNKDEHKWLKEKDKKTGTIRYHFGYNNNLYFSPDIGFYTNKNGKIEPLEGCQSLDINGNATDEIGTEGPEVTSSLKSRYPNV